MFVSVHKSININNISVQSISLESSNINIYFVLYHIFMCVFPREPYDVVTKHDLGFTYLLDGHLDVFVARGLVETAREVHHGHVGCRHSERHPR